MAAEIFDSYSVSLVWVSHIALTPSGRCQVAEPEVVAIPLERKFDLFSL